jgi:hypothetical protein
MTVDAHRRRPTQEVRAMVMTERIDLAGVVGVADRAIVRQFNAAIGRGMQGIAGMCALMFTEPCFAEYVDHYVGTVADAEYERAVRSDLLSMGYEVDDYGAELVLLPEEERLKRGIERILLPRKLTEEEEEKYNEVLSAVRQVYATAAPTGTPEELATGMVVARQLCLAFNWRAVPTEEDEARAFLHTICKSITGSMEGGTLQWIRAVESVYYADGYATATKARDKQGFAMYLDASVHAARELCTLLCAVNWAACSDRTATRVCGICASCAACRDMPLSSATIRIDTPAGRKDPVDDEYVRMYLREEVCIGDSLHSRASRATRGLCETPVDVFSWANFMSLFTSVVYASTGVKWDARFARASRYTNRISLSMHPSSAPGVRFYAEALRTRAAIEPDAPYAPIAQGIDPRARIGALLARIGPFAPIDGTD